MDADPSRRTRRCMYDAALLTEHALTLDGALQLAAESGALLLVEQSLAALVAELAAPQPLVSQPWVLMLQQLPESLQERRLLERALLTAEGELYGLYLRLEHQRTGRPAASGMIITTASPQEQLLQLKGQLEALRALANTLRESSQFC